MPVKWVLHKYRRAATSQTERSLTTRAESTMRGLRQFLFPGDPAPAFALDESFWGILVRDFHPATMRFSLTTGATRGNEARVVLFALTITALVMFPLR